MNRLVAQVIWEGLSMPNLVGHGPTLDRMAALMGMRRIIRPWWLPDEGDTSLRRRMVIELARRVRAGEVTP